LHWCLLLFIPKKPEKQDLNASFHDTKWKFSGNNGLFKNQSAPETFRACQAPIRIHKRLLSTVKASEKVNTLTNFVPKNKFSVFQVRDPHYHYS